MEQPSPKPSISRQDHNAPSLPQQRESSPQPPTFPTTEVPDDELNLRGFIALIRRRSLIIAGVSITVIAFIIGFTLTQEKVYGGRFRILVEPVNNPDRNLSGLTANTSPGNQSDLDYDTQIQVLRNPKLIIETVNQLQSSYPNLNALSLLGNLTIQRLQETKILEVSYQSTNPAEVQDVLDQLAKDYLDYSLKERQSNLRQGIQFIENQLPVTQSRVDQLQKELQVFRQQNNFVDPGTQTSLVTSQVSQLIQQRFSVEQILAQTRSSFALLQGRTGSLAALNNSGTYLQLINQLRQVEIEIATEQTRFQDNSLTIKVLRERRERLLPVLQEEAQRVVDGQVAQVVTQIQTLEVQRQAIAQAQSELNQKVEELPILIRRYTDLQRELEVSTASLSRFLAARESLEIEASQREIPWQVVEAPLRFSAPISPNLRRSIVLGVLVSLALGFSTALVIDKLNDVYYTVEDLKAKTRLPLLGVISFQRELQEIEERIIQERKPLANLEELKVPATAEGVEQLSGTRSISQGASKFLAAFQVLRTKIQLLSADQPIRSIVISSSVAEEGKSTVALFLAQTAAEMGQRVLLVNADLRQSKFQTRLNLDNPKGLSNLIAQQLPLNDVIYQPLQEPGFFLLPAGDLPPNPIKLLSSRRMQELIEELPSFFDLVIYDVPHMDGLADASLLAPYTDGIVLVIRLGKTERFAVTQTLDNLKLSQMPVLGMVVNGV